MKYIGVVNEKEYKGYSSTVKALLENVKNKEIIDIGETSIEEAIKKISEEKYLVNVVSAADMGIKFFNELGKLKKKNISYVLSSDKFYDIELKNLNDLTVIAPEEAIEKYRVKNNKVSISGYNADLVASPTKEEMYKRANDFIAKNPVVDDFVFSALDLGGKVFFMGGRVSLPDGSFKENSTRVFSEAGRMFAEDGRNGVVVFHGLRSFTKGDKSNDFAPVEAFYDSVKRNMKDSQNIILITKRLDDDGNRISTLKTLRKFDGIIFSNNYDINDSEFGAADYYYLLTEAVRRKLDLTVTIEQMNFVPEALELGANREKLCPYKWELRVPSNEATYQKVFDGKNVRTQKQAFEDYVRNKDIEDAKFINAIYGIQR